MRPFFRPALVAVALLGAACGSAAPSAQVTGEAPPETTVAVLEAVETTMAPTTTAAPTTTVDAREALVAELQDAVDAWRENNGAPAVSFSVRIPGEAPINLASGVVDLISEEPVSSDDYFRIASITNEGDCLRIAFEAPPEVHRTLVPKGSITVDGISLTMVVLTTFLMPLTLLGAWTGEVDPAPGAGDRQGGHGAPEAPRSAAGGATAKPQA